MTDLRAWLRDEAGLTGAKLDVACEALAKDLIESVDELQEMLQEGTLEKLFSNSFVYTKVKKALEKQSDPSNKTADSVAKAADQRAIVLPAGKAYGMLCEC